jgi:hypothetical protein
MSHAWHCDGPNCDTWTRGLGIDDWPILTVTQHYCSWDCVLRYMAFEKLNAASKTPTEVIQA